MGRPKQLLKFRGTSLLRRAIDTAVAVPADQVIVVLGHAADQLMLECEQTGATVVLNDQWAEGVSTSLRGGLVAVSSEADLRTKGRVRLTRGTRSYGRHPRVRPPIQVQNRQKATMGRLFWS